MAGGRTKFWGCLAQLAILVTLAPLPLHAGSTLNFPRLSFEKDVLTGIAIANPSDQNAQITITAYGQDGLPLSGLTSTVQVTVAAQQQLARLTSELFGTGLDPATVAWFQATSSVDDLTGFFLFLNPTFTLLDGAELPEADRQIVFTLVRLGAEGSTELNIINPGPNTAELELQLIRSDALPVGKALSLPGKGVVRLDAGTFFGVSEAPPGSYVKVISNVSVGGFEVVSPLEGDPVGLNARSTSEQLTHLYFPQIAVLGPFETILGVVNNSTQAAVLTITAFTPEGALYDTQHLKNNPITRSLNPGEGLVEDVESMFGFTGAELLVGWLQVEATSESITGFITYGIPSTGSAATVIPNAVGLTRAIFSHIATIDDFFTGVAVLNAGQLAANIQVLALKPSGQILGRFATVLQPGHRISKLIHELIPEAAHQSGGLIWTSSDLPVYLTSLFGSAKVLANVPPQPSPEGYAPDAGLEIIKVKPPLSIVQPNNVQSFEVEGIAGGVVWKVNGIEGGDPAVGTISPTGLYVAPNTVPSPAVVTVSADVGSQTAGASVDILEKSALLSSETVIQSVTYLSSLEKIYTAELTLLSSAAGFFLQSLGPEQEEGDTEIFEVAAPGVPKVPVTTFKGETISKMIPFLASTGKEFLLLAARTSGRVIRFDPTTLQAIDVAGGLNQPSALVIDPNTGSLLVAEQDRITLIPKQQLEADLLPPAGAPPDQVYPQAVTVFLAEGADGITVDRCSGDVYFSEAEAGVIWQFVADASQLRIFFSGLAQPGPLLALYRNGVACPDSFQVLVIEGGADRVTLLNPSQGVVTPWIAAADSTDLAFLPANTPFAPNASALLTELIDAAPAQPGSRYSLLTVQLPKLYRSQPDNPVTKPPLPEIPVPELISPTEGASIRQNDSSIKCPSDPSRGFGYQIEFDWTDSSSPAAIVGYDLLVRNISAFRPLIDTFVTASQFTQTSCNSVVIEENLEGWEWRVRAKDSQGNFSEWSRTGSFRFAPCRLDGSTPCLSGSDLSVAKRASPALVDPGTVLTYTVTVKNAGPSTATGVTVSDRLDFRVSFGSARASQGGCLESGGIVNCNLGTLESGSAATITIDVVVRESAAGATLINSVLVQSAQGDPDLSNNRVELQTVVQKGTVSQSDLSLSKKDFPDPVEVGGLLTYTLAVMNNGPAAATDVRLVDTLPLGVTVGAFRTSQGECSESRGTITCGLKTLESGGTATVIIEVKVGSSAAILVNTAFVKAAEDDPVPFNNSISVETAVKARLTVQSDLSVKKTDSIDPVAPATALTYSLAVANAGPSPATQVTLLDQLPGGVTFLGAKAGQGSCIELVGLVSCSLGVLDPGATAEVSIGVNVSSSATGTTLTNEAEVSGAEPDPDESNNRASEQTAVGQARESLAADLSLSKTDSLDPVEVGVPLTYTLTVKNAGPSAANGVLLSDTLPAGVSFKDVNTSQGKCAGSGGIVSCELGTVQAGVSAVISIVVDVNPSAADTTLINTAQVRAEEEDFNPGNNVAEEKTTVVSSTKPGADLSLTKADSVDPVKAGGELTYGLTVRNAGPGTATAVTVSDTLPPGTSFVSASASQGECAHSSGLVTCKLGTLGNGATAAISINVSVNVFLSGGKLVNSASVRAAESDPNQANNTDTEETTVGSTGAQSDLALSKSDFPDPVKPEGSLTYTLVVKNGGPGKASEVVLTDTLPAGLSFVAADPTQGSCLPSGAVTCNLGALESGAGATVRINVFVERSAAGTVLVNTARVRALELDPNEGNNAAEQKTQVEKLPEPTPEQADLSLSKSDSADPVKPESQFTYTLTVKNAGPGRATSVSVGDTLPSGVSVLEAVASQGTCFPSGTVNCSLGTLESGTSASVKITVAVSPSATGTLVNTAQVRGAESDPNESNNSAQETTTVQTAPGPTPEADLFLGKSDSPDPVKPGGSLTYALTVTNRGPSRASEVTLEDTLPSAVSSPRVSASQGSCSGTTTIRCGLGVLESGASAQVTIDVIVNSLASGMLSNRASVKALEPDPNGANNSDVAETLVQTAPEPTPSEADLSLSKSDSTDPVVAGGPLTYTLTVKNNGPAPATGVSLTDSLDQTRVEFVAVDVDTPQGKCDGSSSGVECSLGTLENGLTVTVHIKVVVSPKAVGATLSNTAKVGASEPDPDPFNNSATETTKVIP